MAITNHERVGKGLELLRTGLAPFVHRELRAALEDGLDGHVLKRYAEDPLLADKNVDDWDSAALLKVMWETWNEVFRKSLGPAERSLVGEMRGHRNRWAHQEKFSSDDADRALDSAERLLSAVSAPEAEEVRKAKQELRRTMFDEQARRERRKGGSTLIESPVTGTLKPWREVVNPHADVASGRYQQAEFAADLWQVHVGEGTDEYRNPVEFFRRTFLTESLGRMLVNATHRLSGAGGDPVVQLQTNFGGGKTHSMLALYHLFSGADSTQLPGVEALFKAAGIDEVPTARRVVLVGNKISPGNPSRKADGTEVRTLWGELAWQLGGAEAYARIAADDAMATSPGDALRGLFNDYGPCLILVDEWVAYARQLHEGDDLPGGSFETQFSFAQVLTESAKLADRCLLLISLPASDTAMASPHAQANDEEVGGQRGREALSRLQNVIGRVESSWRPASAEEGFEIVRRRLFEPMTQPQQFTDRDVIARGFSDFYQSQQQEFPTECREGDYEARLKAAYPIHPEVFDRLYSDWSTLVKFQRTRGVLRLMAAVIHSLWEKGDRNPLIMPANIAIDDERVQFELTRYLSDSWVPIIEKDIDGAGSLPLRIDSDVPNLGRAHATRRVARTIYLGSAPNPSAANRGLEDRRIKLGCVMPGESPSVFGDALRRLAGAATYLYQDGPRYWYDTQPTVTKLAEDRAQQLRSDPDGVHAELDRRLREDLRDPGDFSRVHPLPTSGADVADDLDARLVVLGLDQSFSKAADNAAEAAARVVLESRGNAPRLYRNTLVFLAADAARVQTLDEAIRLYLAWKSILDDRETLNLSPHQVKQAETQFKSAESTVAARLPDTYQWLLVPTQATPQETFTFSASRMSGQDALAARASKKLRSDETLILAFAPTLLRMELDRIPLWRGDSVTVRQLAEDFAQYLYLPRLLSSRVLLEAIADGVASLSWERDTFAFADSYDETEGRYRALRASQQISLPDVNAPGMLVRPDVAKAQMDAERAAPATTPGPAEPGGAPEQPGVTVPGVKEPGPDGGGVEPPRPRRFHGTVQLDGARVGRDAGQIAEEVISHLSGLMGAEVRVTLEVEANVPSGVSEQVVRIVTENARTLKFDSQGFEEE